MHLFVYILMYIHVYGPHWRSAICTNRGRVAPDILCILLTDSKVHIYIVIDVQRRAVICILHIKRYGKYHSQVRNVRSVMCIPVHSLACNTLNFYAILLNIQSNRHTLW